MLQTCWCTVESTICILTLSACVSSLNVSTRGLSCFGPFVLIIELFQQQIAEPSFVTEAHNLLMHLATQSSHPWPYDANALHDMQVCLLPVLSAADKVNIITYAGSLSPYLFSVIGCLTEKSLHSSKRVHEYRAHLRECLDWLSTQGTLLHFAHDTIPAPDMIPIVLRSSACCFECKVPLAVSGLQVHVWLLNRLHHNFHSVEPLFMLPGAQRLLDVAILCSLGVNLIYITIPADTLDTTVINSTTILRTHSVSGLKAGFCGAFSSPPGNCKRPPSKTCPHTWFRTVRQLTHPLNASAHVHGNHRIVELTGQLGETHVCPLNIPASSRLHCRGLATRLLGLLVKGWRHDVHHQLWDDINSLTRFVILGSSVANQDFVIHDNDFATGLSRLLATGHCPKGASRKCSVNTPDFWLLWCVLLLSQHVVECGSMLALPPHTDMHSDTLFVPLPSFCTLTVLGTTIAARLFILGQCWSQRHRIRAACPTSLPGAATVLCVSFLRRPLCSSPSPGGTASSSDDKRAEYIRLMRSCANTHCAGSAVAERRLTKHAQHSMLGKASGLCASAVHTLLLHALPYFSFCSFFPSFALQEVPRMALVCIITAERSLWIYLPHPVSASWLCNLCLDMPQSLPASGAYVLLHSIPVTPSDRSVVALFHGSVIRVVPRLCGGMQERARSAIAEDPGYHSFSEDDSNHYELEHDFFTNSYCDI